MTLFTQKQKQFALTSAAGVLLIGVILLLVNVLFNWVYLRWDLTRHHAYSLSPASKKFVRQLDDPVVIKAYFTPDLPPPYNTYARYVKDILAEYRSASHGRVHFEFVPTQPAKDFEEKAMSASMTPIQFEQMESDQLQIRRGFMGLVLFYRDRSEVLPVVKSPEHLEYDVTSRIARMARKNKKQIGTILGHGETPWRGSQIKLAQDLPAFYDLDHPIALPLATTGPISADAILIVGPQQKYDAPSLWAIDQMLMRGVPMAFLIDTKRFVNAQFMMAPLTTGLEDLLKTYGVKLTDQLVYDAECESVGMTQNVGGMAFTTSVRYPYIPQVTRFEPNHPILSGIESVSLPFPTRLDAGTLPKGVRFTPLLYSSEHSWLAPPETYSVSPTSIPHPKPDEPHGPYVLGGLLEGTFPSYFAGKPSPVKGEAVIPESPKTSIFILTTSHVLDQGLPEFQGVDALVTNALAYLSHDDTLIGIQAKGDIIRPLKPIPIPARDAVKFGCVLGIPLLPVAWGLIRWRRRDAWRKTIAATA